MDNRSRDGSPARRACTRPGAACRVVLAAVVALAAVRAPAAESAAIPRGIGGLFADGGSSSRDMLRQSLGSLPLDRMPAAHRKEIESFARSTTIFRRLPEATVTCDADLLGFLLDKPDALVDVWRVLDISRLSLDPVAQGQWRLSDGYGTDGTVRLLHRERSRHGGLLVFHGRGAYTGPLSPKKLTGSCLVVVRHRPEGGDEFGTPRHAVTIDAFLDVDGLGLEIVTRALQPLIVHSAASNLHEIALFVTQFAAAGARNPGGVARLTERMTRTSPEDRRLLASLAGGAPLSGAADAAAEELRAELASRWLSVDQLDANRRR